MSTPTDTPAPRTVAVEMLTRVEGEGALRVRLDGDRVVEAALEIFEPPRLFEAILEGRHFTEAPDITARICGICPVAYQMSSCHALEAACGVRVDGALRELRRLLCCAEWLESHALHVFMLHAPDFLGYESAIAMAVEHPEPVQRGLALKKLGNDLLALLGGRSIHPVNVRVGGFYRLPDRGRLEGMRERLEEARESCRWTLDWLSGFDYPDFERPVELVSLVHPEEYPMNEGRLVSSEGLDVAVEEFEAVVEEEHVERSNALHARLRGRGAYLVGPLARYSLNFERLSVGAREAALATGLGPTCRNPFRSIQVRAVEMLFACEEALRILDVYTPPEEPAVEVTPRAANGCAATEAPRGLLYHRYGIDERGILGQVRIVPPTSQNQPSVEEDLREFVGAHLELSEEELTWRAEQIVRNYDPCISCATHFLKLDLERT